MVGHSAVVAGGIAAVVVVLPVVAFVLVVKLVHCMG